MLELFPEGFEEVDQRRRRRARRLHRPGRRGAALGGVRRRAARTTSRRAGRTAGARSTGRCGSGRSGSGRRGRSPTPDAIAVVIDPGRAFGTGSHATTRLCLELLLDQPRGSLLDVGCGSGVLAIAAAKLGFDPVHAVDVDPQAIEATNANAARERRRPSTASARRRRCRIRFPPRTCAVMNVSLEHRRRRRRAARLHTPDHFRLSRLGVAGVPRLPRAKRAARPRAGRPTCISGRSKVRAMATFSVDFLGCKVSHADAQAVRERAARRRSRGAGRRRRRRRDQHVLRDARGAAEVAPRRVARRAHARPGLRDRLRREPLGRRLRRAPGERGRGRALERGDARSRRRRRRRDRLRPGRGAARPRPRVRQGAGRLQLLVQLLRDPARARRLAQPARGRRCSPRSAAVSTRATSRSCSPGSTSAATATARPATTWPRLMREAGATPGLARLRLSSIEVNHLTETAARRAARDADGLAPPARAAPVRRRRRAARDGATVRLADVPAPGRARPATST